VASRMAVETIRASLESRDVRWSAEDLRASLEQANTRVLQESLHDPNKHGMGTTAVLLVVGREADIMLAHVGDSRAYALTSQGFKQLTEDHSVVYQLVKEGKITEEEARFHPGRGALLRSLGVQDAVEVDTAEHTFDWDAILLCTDGLTEMLRDEEIEKILRDEQDPQDACEALVHQANSAGGRDNITVIVIRKSEN
jgi:serine/threonine protein phosphatase PrpC